MNLLRTTLNVTTAFVFATLPLDLALGQAAKVTCEAPTFDDLPSPEFPVVKNRPFKPKDWLEIEAKLRVQLAPEPASKTCDKITVKWYVAVKNVDKSGTYLLLTKDIDYVNIPLNEDVYFSVYLSPSSVKRLTGVDRAGKSTVELVGYEVLVNGEKLGQESNKSGGAGKAGWWNQASDKVSRSDKVPLLNKSETPFSPMWWDRYAEVSQERR